ncbi:MAG: hypothetical protein M1115_08390 [Actinobacteria bacterium]|nr:hypothetical protein [Actinomycetota bacterium]
MPAVASASTSGVASTWTELSPQTSPLTLQIADIAYDPSTSQVVMLGGEDTLGISSGATWVWNGSSWTEMSPQASPPPLANSAVAYDTSSDQTLLFGGTSSSGPSAETWLWEAVTLEAPRSITSLASLDGSNLIVSTTVAVTINDTRKGT